MTEKVGFKELLKGFFLLETSWLKKYFINLILAILLGVICGLAMVGFNYLLIFFKIGFSYLPYFLSPIIAGGLTCLLVRFGHYDRIMGTGASEFIEEIHEPEMVSKRIPNTIAKTFATSWTYGSGMVCGIEGPGILIGANLGYIISKIFHQNVKDYNFIGASACTGAILKAPISGALFCAELPYYNHVQYKSLIPSLIASIVAYLIFCLYFEFTPLIRTDIPSLTPNETNYLILLPLLVIFGIITGIIVFIYNGMLRSFTNKLQKTIGFKYGLWILPLIGAIGYSVLLLILIPFLSEEYINMFIGPDSSFLNFFINIVDKATTNWVFLLVLLLLFAIAIVLCIGTTNSAGIILPMMLFGAILGAIFGNLFYSENPELFVLVGIAAVLAGSFNNPIASILIIIEMTWVPMLFIPAGITAIIAYIFSGPSSIVHGQQHV
ncbi:MAG: chloride channel protein [Candidatus Thorarchaeota archaeon]